MTSQTPSSAKRSPRCASFPWDYVQKTPNDDCSPTYRKVLRPDPTLGEVLFDRDDHSRHADVVTSTTTSQPGLLRRRALALAWLTVIWNAIEAIVAIVAGREAGSLVLVGFGLDSTIEVASAGVIIWQFSGHDQEREQRALRLIAVGFFALAVYITAQAGFNLVAGREPESSAIGLALAVASLIVMPILATAKHSTGRRLGSATVTADSRQTWLCTYLSVVLLTGLLLNATLGWWWADPVAALIIAALAVREGLEAWRGVGCCD